MSQRDFGTKPGVARHELPRVVNEQSATPTALRKIGPRISIAAAPVRNLFEVGKPIRRDPG
jgi:hypothetical protein